jgi:hypothetical protein
VATPKSALSLTVHDPELFIVSTVLGSGMKKRARIMLEDRMRTWLKLLYHEDQEIDINFVGVKCVRLCSVILVELPVCWWSIGFKWPFSGSRGQAR